MRQKRVRAVTLEPQRGFRFAKAAGEAYFLLLQHGFGRQRKGWGG